MTYTAPHSGLNRVITAARAVVGAADLPAAFVASVELKDALVALDTEMGMLATKQEVDEATDAHEGYGDDVFVNVDRFGSALVSHGDDGYWVSGWVFVPVPPEEEDDQ
jgi:hypothetical protein